MPLAIDALVCVAQHSVWVDGGFPALAALFRLLATCTGLRRSGIHKWRFVFRAPIASLKGATWHRPLLVQTVLLDSRHVYLFMGPRPLPPQTTTTTTTLMDPTTGAPCLVLPPNIGIKMISVTKEELEWSRDAGTLLHASAHDCFETKTARVISTCHALDPYPISAALPLLSRPELTLDVAARFMTVPLDDTPNLSIPVVVRVAQAWMALATRIAKGTAPPAFTLVCDKLKSVVRYFVRLPATSRPPNPANDHGAFLCEAGAEPLLVAVIQDVVAVRVKWSRHLKWYADLWESARARLLRWPMALAALSKALAPHARDALAFCDARVRVKDLPREVADCLVWAGEGGMGYDPTFSNFGCVSPKRGYPQLKKLKDAIAQVGTLQGAAEEEKNLAYVRNGMRVCLSEEERAAPWLVNFERWIRRLKRLGKECDTHKMDQILSTDEAFRGWVPVSLDVGKASDLVRRVFKKDADFGLQLALIGWLEAADGRVAAARHALVRWDCLPTEVVDSDAMSGVVADAAGRHASWGW